MVAHGIRATAAHLPAKSRGLGRREIMVSVVQSPVKRPSVAASHARGTVKGRSRADRGNAEWRDEFRTPRQPDREHDADGEREDADPL